MPQNNNPLQFRISYIILPLAVLFLTAGLAAVFYGQLPADIHYRFNLEGEPSGEAVSKLVFTVLMLGIQLVLSAAAYLTVKIIGQVKLFQENASSLVFDPARLLTIMGNLPAIAQLIMGYVLLDSIFYALQNEHLMHLWLFALVVLVIGGIVLIGYALPMVIRAYRSFNSHQDNKKE